MNPQAAQSYLRTRVLTATPEQLQMMLYDGAIRFSETARTAIIKRDWEATYRNITSAQKIVTELITSLKHDVNPDLCGKMASIYNYIYRRLIEAGMQHTLSSIDEAIKLLKFQRDTWAMLMEKLGKQKAAAAASKIDVPPPNARMEAALSIQG